MTPADQAGERFRKLVGIVGALRDPGGCPWDRAQDVRSIVDYFLEEAYEAAEACLGGKAEAAAEELGDLLMEIVFLARLFEERNQFSVSDALDRINSKMIDRHPHVFGEAKMAKASEVVDEWQKRKLLEKGRDSVLDGIGSLTPGLLASFQIGQRVSSLGFDWASSGEAMVKVREELGELEKAMVNGEADEVEEELGDLLFALVNVSRHLRINPEIAVRRANLKFSKRFQRLEKAIRDEGRDIGEVGLREMEEVWEKIKR